MSSISWSVNGAIRSGMGCIVGMRLPPLSTRIPRCRKRTLRVCVARAPTKSSDTVCSLVGCDVSVVVRLERCRVRFDRVGLRVELKWCSKSRV